MNSSLNVTAVVTPEVAAIKVAGIGVDGFTERDLTGTGWAKKHPRDYENEDLAFALAMARALQNLANQYARQAADLAGFPVTVELDAVGADGRELAISHHPSVDVDLEEKVDF